MKFWKMNGAGNDFIILNNLEEHASEEKLSRITQILCKQHLSIGADGLMVVDAPENGGDFKMLYFNADGSMGEMCGNGARCICRYAYENGLSGDIQTVETTAGIIKGRRIDERHYRVQLNNPTTVELEKTIEIENVPYVCSYVELGSPGIPHAIVSFPEFLNTDEDQLRELGRAIRWHKAFPKGANVTFYNIREKDMVDGRTFERGVEDFTYACGTGAGSLVTVLTLIEKVSGKNVRVNMPGGQLIIDTKREEEKITQLYLTGLTNLVAKGEIFDETLKEMLKENIKKN